MRTIKTGDEILVHRYGKGQVIAIENNLLAGSVRYAIHLEKNPFPHPLIHVWPQELQDPEAEVEMPGQDITVSGLGWSAEKVAELLRARRAKLEPFNRAYLKIALCKPPLSSAKDPMNRFFQEGAPEYNAPSLVPIDVARDALVQVERTLYRHKDDAEHRRHFGRFYDARPMEDGDVVLRGRNGPNSLLLSAAEFVAKIRLATPEEQADFYRLKPGNVKFKYSDDAYPCHLSAERWEGFALPYFTADVAMKLLASLEPDDRTWATVIRNGERLRLEDAGSLRESDAVRMDVAPDEDNSGAREITHFAVMHDGQPLWPIGSHLWSWCEVTPAPARQVDDSPSP